MANIEAIADHTRTKGRSLHNQLIADILAEWPTARTGGFMSALKTLPDAEYMQYMAEEEPHWFQDCRVIPDAYLIDPEKRHVIAFECVNHHDIDNRKFGRLANIAWALDEDYYIFGLIRCTVFGRQSYCVKSVSTLSDMEAGARGEKRNSFVVPDWPKFTTEYCAKAFATPTARQSGNSKEI